MGILHGMTPKQRKAHQALIVDAVRLENAWESLRVVKDLLEAFPEWINAVDDGKNTAVSIAAAKVRLDVVDFLLNKGANPTLKNQDGDDALGRAVVVQENHRIQEAVTNAVLDSNAFTKDQMSEALKTAAEMNSLGAARALLQRGADFALFPDLSGTPGTALREACLNSNGMGDKRCPVVQLLLDDARSLPVLNLGWGSQGAWRAPIHGAAGIGSTGVVQQLVEKGAWINPPAEMAEAEKHPVTPLMDAAWGGFPETIAFLLERGADPRAVDETGRNALHYLMGTDLECDGEEELALWVPCLKALLDAGADPMAVDQSGHSALSRAKHNGRHHMTGILTALYAEQLEKRLAPGSPQAGGAPVVSPTAKNAARRTLEAPRFENKIVTIITI